MVEPVTTVGLGAIAAYLGKDGLQKLLGPTADYLGGGLKDFTQRRIETIGRVFQNATKKLGKRIDKPGEVPPKILKSIVDDGSYSNDELAVEYLGGILASSRSEQGRDDRGARMSKMVDSLSTYQLRTHYLIYSTVRTLFRDKSLILDPEGRARMQIFLPISGYAAAMEFSREEQKKFNALATHVFFGLSADCLIETEWWIAHHQDLKKRFAGAAEDGILCAPSAPGAELFLWAFGISDQPEDYIFDPAFDCTIGGLPAPGISGALPTRPQAPNAAPTGG
jgi:hypothetical protein